MIQLIGVFSNLFWEGSISQSCLLDGSWNVSPCHHIRLQLMASFVINFWARRPSDEVIFYQPLFLFYASKYPFCSLKVKISSSVFKFHPKCEYLRITYLAFAEDIMLISRGDAYSVRTLIGCLGEFGDYSGMGKNTLKSNLNTANLVGENLRVIQQITHFSIGLMLFRYPGIPLSAEKLKAMHFTPFIVKIVACINVWTSATLSYACYTKLIRSVLQGVEYFWLSTFLYWLLFEKELFAFAGIFFRTQNIHT